MRTLPPAVRERIAREFSAEEREQAEYVLRGYHVYYTGMPTWKFDELLDRAGGDLERLRDATQPEEDFRDLIVGKDGGRALEQLAASGGEGPVAPGVIGAGMVEKLRRDYRRSRERALHVFPPDRVNEVLLGMGVSWPSNADEIFALAGGDADRLAAMLEARPAREVDPSIPAALAHLPCAAAWLIRRDFAPQAWPAAARLAAVAPRGRSVGGVLVWLLLAEYAGGDPGELEWAVHMLDGNYGALSAGVARKRAERRKAQGG